MTSSVVSEVPPGLLFRYRLRCPMIGKDTKAAEELSKFDALPELAGLGQSGPGPFAELRAAWSMSGIYFSLVVKGKKQSVWCRSTQLLESDGIQIWIDTRDTHNVHRATRFCHWFLMMPAGHGNNQDKPFGTMLNINRAREHSPSVNRFPLQLKSTIQKSGYNLSAFLPAGALNGWAPDEYRKVGFNYLVVDRELGQQTLGVGSNYPIAEDPSLWSTLQLTK